ncbi:hypothetical protein [Serinicoccus sp. LYQ131]|uniref:hypothetical protein n=1 Tax=Serinicoccus sp. LYQ131 TaxID=3378797 RepID=UPI003851DCD9
MQKQRRPALAQASLDWSGLGFEPRWVGFDAADCATALQPSIYAGQGAHEFDRFRQAAESRGETALVISPIGQLQEGHTQNVFGASDSINPGRAKSRISGRPLGKGASVRAAHGLGDADGLLALRLLSCDPQPSWWTLSLDGVTSEAYNVPVHHPTQGSLEPIIVTELGEPVVAAWVSPDGVERRYVVPFETPWPVLLRWLLEHGLPEFVPGAMRRARRHLASDMTTMTRRERDARSALLELEADYTTRRADLKRELGKLQAAASEVREGLLYGTGGALVDAVRAVLESADVKVVDLDEDLGGTKNADLLCSYGGRARLVEVKSASGRASERAYQDLVRHLREWEQLPTTTPIDGGALVLNHQHRLVPSDRKQEPYDRPEFLAAQTEPVIATLALFEAWREENVAAVRRLIFGHADPLMSEPTEEPGSASSKRGWLRRASAAKP